MKYFRLICTLFALSIGLVKPVMGQAPMPVEEELPTSAPTNWHLLDPSSDEFQGIGAIRAYNEVLKDKTATEIVVAVIDSGIDIKHEDLDGVIWVNEDEIPGNGVDDDGNGYVDDINGWNFIGGPDGSHVEGETFELTREYIKLKPKYENAKRENLSGDALKEYTYFKELEEAFEKKSDEAEQGLNNYMQYLFYFKIAKDMIVPELGDKEFTLENIRSLETDNDTIKGMQQMVVSLMEQGADEAVLQEGFDHFQDTKNYHLNTEENFRAIVQDNPDDPTERYYGNNDVVGPDPKHGTHVAGIIAAERFNNQGMDGIANNVKIMVIRAVPNGDERDKDVANAIRYAVDNGAKIVNMSFGKDYSPHKDVVDKAIKYAQKKKVLLIHGSGNDGSNNDEIAGFPSKSLKKTLGGKMAKNWIEVGASSWGRDGLFVADFSNYGDVMVDIFAPGVDIYSSIPGSKYENMNGTSMASPVVAGVAAALWSYYPKLKYKQVKSIILETATRYPGKQVTIPGGDEKVSFDSLSSSDGIVNLYKAVKMAESLQ